MIEAIIEGLISVFAGDAVESAIRRRRERRARAAGRVLGAMRVVSGEAAGLLNHWQVVELQPGPRRLDGKRLSLNLRSLSRQTARPKLMEEAPMGVDAVTFALRTESGVVEWAIPAVDAGSIGERLGLIVGA